MSLLNRYSLITFCLNTFYVLIVGFNVPSANLILIMYVLSPYLVLKGADASMTNP